MGLPDTTRPLRYVQTTRHRELEALPLEIMEYAQPDGAIREYVSAGRSLPMYRRMPIEVGEGEHPRRTQEYLLPNRGHLKFGCAKGISTVRA